MERIILNWVINTISIMLAIKFVPGIVYSGKWSGILIVGLIFGLVNTIIRPIVSFFTFPLLILSLGLFTFIINAMMLSMTSWVSGEFRLGFHVYGFRAAFWGALIISILTMVLHWLMPSERLDIR